MCFVRKCWISYFTLSNALQKIQETARRRCCRTRRALHRRKYSGSSFVCSHRTLKKRLKKIEGAERYAYYKHPFYDTYNRAPLRPTVHGSYHALVFLDHFGQFIHFFLQFNVRIHRGTLTHYRAAFQRETMPHGSRRGEFVSPPAMFSFADSFASSSIASSPLSTSPPNFSTRRVRLFSYAIEE